MLEMFCTFGINQLTTGTAPAHDDHVCGAGAADVLHDAQVSVLVTTTGLVLVDFQSSHPVVVVLTTGLVEVVDFQSSQLAVVVVLTTGLVEVVEAHSDH